MATHIHIYTGRRKTGDEVRHDPKNGQFTSGGGSSGASSGKTKKGGTGSQESRLAEHKTKMKALLNKLPKSASGNYHSDDVPGLAIHNIYHNAGEVKFQVRSSSEGAARYISRLTGQEWNGHGSLNLSPEQSEKLINTLELKGKA